MTARLLRIYETLLGAYGPQGWWPSDGPFEMMVGAVLTQGTAWTNAARAIDALRHAGALRSARLAAMPGSEIRSLIRPAGFFRRKARTLAALSALIEGRDGGLGGLLEDDTPTLRRTLLGVDGIGEETADAILLYAAGRPVFVVDAYTRRLAVRHGIAPEGACYAQVQRAFADALPGDATLLGEFHALIVELGKRSCRPVPLCEGCPLAGDLSQDRPAGGEADGN